MRILFLSRWFPYPANNGSKLRIYNLLRGLAQMHEITLLSFVDEPGAKPNAPQLTSLCRAVHVVPWKPFEPQRWRSRLGLFSLTPRSAVDTYSAEMASCIETTLAERPFDLVIASQWMMAAYGPHFAAIPALFEEVEVALLYEQAARADSAKSRLRHHLMWAKHRRYLAGLARYFEACTVVSERERALLQAEAPQYRTVEVVPNCIDLAEYEAISVAPQPDSLIFTGSFRFAANYEAMVWFLGKVYPRIRVQRPGVRLTITGDHAGLPLPAASNVLQTGFVDDVRPLVAGAWVSLAPLQAGGGTRLKILEAMALGTPVVATSKGAEGLEAVDGHHLLIADTPEDYAEAVCCLLREPDLRHDLADNAYRLVSEKYDWGTAIPRFLELVEQVAQAPASPPSEGLPERAALVEPQ